MAYAKRKDHNQTAIIKALERCGVKVFDSSKMGSGFPDLTIGWRGRTYLAEVKNGERDWRMTPAQEKFHSEWSGGPILVFTCVADVALWIMRETKA